MDQEQTERAVTRQYEKAANVVLSFVGKRPDDSPHLAMAKAAALVVESFLMCCTIVQCTNKPEDVEEKLHILRGGTDELLDGVLNKFIKKAN